ncbi:MAG: Sec-independent protein translocase protein TatB [Pseudomonadota bacterium]|jgi:sec-independent protein translocase protein TatB
MFDIGWPELLVIGLVALIVIGPKDLPRVLHTVGKWVRKARSLARDFQSSVDEMVREAELEDLRKQVQQAKSLNLKDQIADTLDPKRELRDTLTFDDLAIGGVEEDEDEDEGKRATPAPSPAPAPAAPVAGPAAATPAAPVTAAAQAGSGVPLVAGTSAPAATATDPAPADQGSPAMPPLTVPPTKAEPVPVSSPTADRSQG